MAARDRKGIWGFVLGVANLVFTTFVIGRWPDRYWVWYVSSCVVLLSWRLYTYKRSGMHYYMFDFCYSVNLLCISLCIYAFVRREFEIHTPLDDYFWMLTLSVFAWASGPLSVSIPLFRNSLVFHDDDKLTSVFIHASPAVLCWVLRWESKLHFDMFQFGERSLEDANFFRLTLVPFVLYLAIWAIPHYIWMFEIRFKRIIERDYQILFLYVMDTYRPIQRLMENVPKKRQPAVYMLLHAVWVFLTLCLVPLWWSSFYAHTCYLLTTLLISTYNGATFYFRVFAKEQTRTINVN